MSPKPVILVCSAWPPGVGGAVSFALRFARSPNIVAAFDIRRHQILKRPSRYLARDRSLAQSPVGPPLRLFSGLLNFLNYLRMLVTSRPQIVHVNFNGGLTGPLMLETTTYLLLAQLFGARTAVRLGGRYHLFDLPMPPRGMPLLLRTCLRQLDLLVVQCEAWRQREQEWLRQAGVPNRVTAVPNTVDLAGFTVRRAGVSTQPELRIGCVAGPETDVKGAYVLLDSLTTLAAITTGVAIRLSAVAASDAFKKAVRERGLQDTVESVGVLAPEQLRAWLTSLDLFALPSLAEGFPNILLEAMASGVPVVASTVGAIPHIVEGNVEVELVPPGDPHALAHALKKLIIDPELRDQRAVAGLAAVRTRFSLESGWDKVLVSEYLRLLDRSFESSHVPRRD